MIRVLGLDLSCESTGVAHPDGTTSTITAPKAAGKTRVLADDLNRLLHIDRAVRAHLMDEPQLVVVEDYAPGIRSAAAHRLAEVAGVARLAVRDFEVPIVLVGTKQLKQYATGKGTADKGDMRIAALKRIGVEFPNDDECDAWWLRQIGIDAYGDSTLDLPAAQRAVLAKIAWPAVDGHAVPAVA